MLDAITVDFLINLIDQYKKLGFLKSKTKSLASWVVTFTEPKAIDKLCTLVDAFRSNPLRSKLTDVELTYFLKIYIEIAALENDYFSNIGVIRSIVDTKISNTLFAIIKIINEAGLLHPDMISILTESWPQIGMDKSCNRPPREKAYKLALKLIPNLKEKEALNKANLRWLILISSYADYNLSKEHAIRIISERLNKLLKTKPLTQEWAVIVASTSDPLASTDKYIESAHLIKPLNAELMQKVCKHPNPIDYALALSDLSLHPNNDTEYNKDILFRSLQPLECLTAILVAAVHELIFNKTLLINNLHPSLFVQDLIYLNKTGIMTDDNINKRASANFTSTKSSNSISELYALSLLNKSSFAILAYFNFSELALNVIKTLGRKFLTHEIVEKILKRNHEWLTRFNDALHHFISNRITVTKDSLDLLLDTKDPFKKATCSVTLIQQTLWNKPIQNLIAKSSAKRGETHAITRTLCSLEDAAMCDATIVDTLTTIIETKSEKRNQRKIQP